MNKTTRCGKCKRFMQSENNGHGLCPKCVPDPEAILGRYDYRCGWRAGGCGRVVKDGETDCDRCPECCEERCL